MMAEAEPGEDPQAADVRRCMVTIKRDRIVEILRSLGACSKPGEAIPWAKSLPAETTAAEAWASCPRGDWLVWLLGRLHVLGLLSRHTLVLAACAAARTFQRNVAPGEDRPRIAIETAEAWTRDEASIGDVCTATAAAFASAFDSSAFVSSSAPSSTAAFAAAYAATSATATSATEAFANAANSCYVSSDPKRLAEIADAVRCAVPWETVKAAVARLSEGSSS